MKEGFCDCVEETTTNSCSYHMIDQAHYALRKHLADDMDEL